MIPADFITEWRGQAPWVESSQVEQDLVISRALVEIFEDDFLAESLAFRGGTALYKLHLTPGPRMSSRGLTAVNMPAISIGPNGPVPVIMGSHPVSASACCPGRAPAMRSVTAETSAQVAVAANQPAPASAVNHRPPS